MTTVIIVIGILLLLVGLAGCIVPGIPGPIVAFLGLLGLSFFTEYVIATDFLYTMGFVVVLVTAFDLWLQPYAVKRFGGGKKATTGTWIGLILGLIVPVPGGVFLGPFLGAYAGARMDGHQDKALKIAFGALVGLLLGTFFKLGVVLYIAYEFISVLNGG
jgi:uncharacterized protein